MGEERIKNRAYIVAFVASFSLMVVEIVAGRILTPYVGVSLYTWTSIIGVVLAGIGGGAYLGGMIADKYPRTSTLGWILFLSGLGTLSIPPLINWMGDAFAGTDLMLRVLLITTAVFLVPSSLLGMVLPVAVKLTLGGLDRTGNVVGKIYAFSTLGSILGTFATGFFLISWAGTRNLLFAMAMLLLLAAPLLGDFFARKSRIFCLVVVLPFLWPLHNHAFNPVLDRETFFFKESDYYTIRLKRTFGNGDDRLVTLYLDQLTHSCSDPDDPLYLQFRYIRSYREIAAWKADERKPLRTLFIGGGGYTFPRYIEARYPRAEIDVVEIDPVVTEVSRKYMGIPPTTRIRTFNEDARWFVMNRQGEGTYDIIFEDAFNDLSIPYHLTTKEFALQLRRLLKKDGLLLTNVIDRFEKGSFLPSYIRTLEEVFGKGNVHLITLGPIGGSAGVINRVVMASAQGVRTEDLAASLDRLEESGRMSHIMPPGRLQEYLKGFRPVVLTDDYAPVDNLTAANFR